MPKPPPSNDPYCSNCGYLLVGLTESSKCPECGKPIVEVLTREPRWTQVGKRYRSSTRVFGLPLIDVAVGSKHNELRGKAIEIIAIGDIATGVFAAGGMARGVVAIGGMAMGLFAFGGLSIGILVAFGGMTIGGIAVGGGAIGVVAQGGGAAGVIADGGGAVGYLARGANARGTYTVSPTASSPGAADMLSRWSWLIGATPGRLGLLKWAAIAGGGVCVVAALVVLLGYIGWRTEGTPKVRGAPPS